MWICVCIYLPLVISAMDYFLPFYYTISQPPPPVVGETTTSVYALPNGKLYKALHENDLFYVMYSGAQNVCTEEHGCRYV